MNSEKDIQDWLEKIIAADGLLQAITGREEVRRALQQFRSVEVWPDFPIDYLSRLRVLEAADGIVGQLCELDPVSSSKRSISRTRGEALFVDLLYARPSGAQFVAIEIKKDKVTSREAVTELLAYEHEIQNHIPFASYRDIILVIVSREFPTLLDHAVCGLITWGRRRILCLKFEDDTGTPKLSIHMPASWAAVGQTSLPADGFRIAQLSLRLTSPLRSEQTQAVFETAAQLMARESDRAGGSGFVFVAEHIFFPDLSESEYVLIAGALNPYCFLPQAEKLVGAMASDSPVSEFLLDEERREDFTLGWDWIGNDGGAAVEYLQQFGDTTWEGFSDWSALRSPHRWRLKHVTPDRYLRPCSADSWGLVGDFMRDAVRRHARLQNFLPSYCKPGIDWRQPHFAAQLLDSMGVEPVVESGQWGFRALFELGVRLGRLTAYGAQYADANEADRRKLGPTLFWAEVDLMPLIEEVRQRYMAAPALENSPPGIRIGTYEDSAQVTAQSVAFAKWISDEFIGSNQPVLQEAFETGNKVYYLYGGTVSDTAEVQALRKQAIDLAREWLTAAIKAAASQTILPGSKHLIRAIAESKFPQLPSFDGPEDNLLKGIARVSDEQLLNALADEIPRMMDCWCVPLAHILAPIQGAPDWDWFEQQIHAHHQKGVPNPCLLISPGGQFGIGSVPVGSMPLPKAADLRTEVLVVFENSIARMALNMSWAELRAGKVPGMVPPPQTNEHLS